MGKVQKPCDSEWTFSVLIPAEVNLLSTECRPDLEAQPASCPVTVWGSFSGCKAAGA
jgi:hypothetical protein